MTDKILIDRELLERMIRATEPDETGSVCTSDIEQCAYDLRAALSAPQQEAVALTSSNQYLAIREAHQNVAADEYFKARPQIDCAYRRKVFESAFNRGFDSCERVIAGGGLPPEGRAGSPGYSPPERQKGHTWNTNLPP